MSWKGGLPSKGWLVIPPRRRTESLTVEENRRVLRFIDRWCRPGPDVRNAVIPGEETEVIEDVKQALGVDNDEW
jgi:hypothetical protein